MFVTDGQNNFILRSRNFQAPGKISTCFAGSQPIFPEPSAT
jgi:hypothetical protein